MNKRLIILITILVAVVILAGVVLLPIGNNSGTTTTTTTGDPINPVKPFEIDLTGYVANIGNATALGVVTEKQSSSFTMREEKAPYFPFSLFNLIAFAAEDEETKNYIVMTTTEYDPNAPEADETGLTKVTFTKTITENITTITTGTKYIATVGGTITIPAVEGFTYNVYLGDELVAPNLTDNCESDVDEREGVIVLEGFVDEEGNPSEGVEYSVKYEGVGEEVIVTQDEINGEIDKLYVVGGYTYISFVPQGTSQRGNNLSRFDDDGIALYDKGGYYSDRNRQSFVIENASGYVYAIENFSIDNIDRGIIVSNGKYYDMTVADNGDLTFTQIVMNETLEIYDVFIDKYGYKYVKNNFLDAYDEENKTLYYTKHEYMLSEEGVTIYYDGTGISKNGQSFETALEKINADFSRSPISKHETYHLNTVIYGLNDVVVKIIENGYLYTYTSSSNGRSSFHRVDTITLLREDKTMGYTSKKDEYSNLSAPIDHNTVLLWSDRSGTPKLYYGEVWGDQELYIPADPNGGIKDSFVNEEVAILLLENCQHEGWTVDLSKLKFRYTTFTETIYYIVVLDENGTPTIVNSETYVAPEQDIVTFQPINAK